MTSTLLLSRAEGPDTSPARAQEPPLAAFSAGQWRYLTTLAPLPRVGLGVEHAR